MKILLVHNRYRERGGEDVVVDATAALLREQTAGQAWVHLPGNVQGRQKAQWLAAADVMLNPGVVGLGVLDAFAAELPLVLGECSAQPPEFAYIEPNINSVLAPPEPAALGKPC